MKFEKLMQTPQSTDYPKACILIFNGKGRLLMPENADPETPFCIFSPKQITAMDLDFFNPLGTLDGIPCFCTGAGKNFLPGHGYNWKNLRSLFFTLEKDAWFLAGYAKQIHDLNTQYRFCSRCGAPTAQKKEEQARFCPECNMTYYPRISPAIITAVTQKNKILLARGVNFPNKKMFSVLAGFVEPQESLEDCIKREVYEETGIRVKNISYFGSQPWPFPDSLMIGFTAEWESGELKIDPDEIVEAAWFSADALPLVPEEQALSGQLIQWFIQKQNASV